MTRPGGGCSSVFARHDTCYSDLFINLFILYQLLNAYTTSPHHFQLEIQFTHIERLQKFFDKAITQIKLAYTLLIKRPFCANFSYPPTVEKSHTEPIAKKKTQIKLDNPKSISELLGRTTHPKFFQASLSNNQMKLFNRDPRRIKKTEKKKKESY